MKIHTFHSGDLHHIEAHTQTSEGLPELLRTFGALLSIIMVRAEQPSCPACQRKGSKHQLSLDVQQLSQIISRLTGQPASALVSPTNKQMAKRESALAKKLRAIIEQRLDEHLSVQQLCKAVGMSPAQLHRKLKAQTGLSATKFIRQIRLEKALLLLRQADHSIASVAYDTGFSDPSYFSRVFKKEFGMSPKAYLKQCTYLS